MECAGMRESTSRNQAKRLECNGAAEPSDTTTSHADCSSLVCELPAWPAGEDRKDVGAVRVISCVTSAMLYFAGTGCQAARNAYRNGTLAGCSKRTVPELR